MRHAHYRGSQAEAKALFERAEVVHLAAVDPEGRPLIRTLHGIVVGEHLAFHAAPKGEKSELPGWRAVVSTESIVAEIPSYFIDPVRACPATTYYESAMVSGVIEEVTAPAERALVLTALMRRFQPEGGYQPIDAESPMYKNAVAGLLIFRLPLDGAVAKIKLGQNRTPDELLLVLEGLWKRGGPKDPAAIDRVIAANAERLDRRPSFLAAPEGIELRCQLSAEHAPEATDLLEGLYWTKDLSRASIAAAQLGATAWVGAIDRTSGKLIGTARALADGARVAWIYDVSIARPWQRRGVGDALVRLLLDHPRLRGVKKVLLGTRDGMPFYARMGFIAVDSPLTTSSGTLMARTLQDAGRPTGGGA